MLLVGICGSPRKGNTELLLDFFLKKVKELGIETVKVNLREHKFLGCASCRCCLSTGKCVLEDDFTLKTVPLLLKADGIVLASPVYFDNVSWLAKKFMDRTWPLRGKLRGKVGGAIVVGRGYGLDMAISAIHNWMLKHEIVLVHRGVRGIAYDLGEIEKDERARKDAEALAKRVSEVIKALR